MEEGVDGLGMLTMGSGPALVGAVEAEIEISAVDRDDGLAGRFWRR